MGAGSSAPVTAYHRPPPPPGTVARCLADWNGPANGAARAAAARPRAPYPLDGGRKVSLRGSFEAYAGLSVVIGAPGTDPSMRCYVFLHFPHGYRGGQASLSFGELNTRRGAYAHDPSVEIGVNADTGGRRPLEDRDGRLSTAGGRRT
jgi:hypothetical protein